jgi:hypothetical protein
MIKRIIKFFQWFNFKKRLEERQKELFLFMRDRKYYKT